MVAVEALTFGSDVAVGVAIGVRVARGCGVFGNLIGPDAADRGALQALNVRSTTSRIPVRVFMCGIKLHPDRSGEFNVL
jgi:hypothetical protein